MSKFCPMCDDVKDSNINSPDDLKQHLEDEHADEIVETGKPERLDDHGGKNKDVEKPAVPAKFREIKEDK